MHQQTQRALERIKQGNFAETVLLPSEDPTQFYELCDQLLLEFRPCGPAEEECLLSIAAPLWRKLRLHMPNTGPRQSVGSNPPEEGPSLSYEDAMAIYRAGRNGTEIDENLQSKLNEVRRRQEGRPPANPQAKTQRTDPKDLMKQRQIMAELDAQISQAMKQMSALKQIKTAGALTR